MSKGKSYAELKHDLETLLDELQSGDVAIDEAMEKYAEGTKLVKELEAQLKVIENKIKKLT